MLEKDRLFNITLSIFYAVTIPALTALGERRLDAHFSLMTLEYTILYALLRPRRKNKELIFPLLIAVFIVLVAKRMLEVLGL